MSNKEKILRYLELGTGKIFSGGFLAQELGISRTAVWKNIQTLIHDGYPVISVPNKGYYLDEKKDILSKNIISSMLNTKFIGKQLEIYKSVESTNDLLKDLAREGAVEGTVVIGDEQTKGKGRRGRSFHSPMGKGVYMSILLRPEMDPESALKITVIAAVAESLAIEELFDIKAEIKWVNDIFIKGRKVSGILTEASMEMESGKLEYVVVGIGVNVAGTKEALPEDVAKTAGFITEFADKDRSRNEVAALILNKFEELYMHWEFKDVLEIYRKRSFLTGKEVTVIKNGEERRAKALDIDDRGNLNVEYDSGARETLSSGEVSVRKNM
ncbi:biotin--[acetyl-CoA-carboxylase] ligase [Alkalibacter saccharofermentans]|uniref:Bifunctional ligase/repressor BirA n=1 Tax=Alkalibacter saccharofermentans DSM 14828 TaxID=1120975 RepID=A0A1M4XVG7_9FIRM|nr:biotin--[acetyl-CoA-carboxylase] ligase [Alkalibacter saccharofermentans]SHE97479.1 BirA family transcriptional regulator, biotin operon repressor / biotin-[acetyl-CoA-carboxylase] ligase [Alkalibacter saccharofermentans DSM 14828]